VTAKYRAARRDDCQPVWILCGRRDHGISWRSDPRPIGGIV